MRLQTFYEDQNNNLHTEEFESVMTYGRNFSLVHCTRLVTELYIIKLTYKFQHTQKQAKNSMNGTHNLRTFGHINDYGGRFI